MTMKAKFPGKCANCGFRFPEGAPIEWARGIGARHINIEACTAAAEAEAKRRAAMTSEPGALEMKPIADFIAAAKERGLKFPKCRFLAPGGGELMLSIAGDKSRVPGSLQVKVDGLWMGRIETDGTVYGANLVHRPEILATLSAIAADPAKAAKEYGALVGRCSFCDLTLTDEGSVEVGYGPVCAKKWGLPHTAKGSKVLKGVVAA